MEMIQRFLLLFVFYAGIKELVTAKKHFDAGQKKWAAASLFIGLFAIVCGIFSAIGSI